MGRVLFASTQKGLLCWQWGQPNEGSLNYV